MESKPELVANSRAPASSPPASQDDRAPDYLWEVESLRLSWSQSETLIRQARRHYPRECCGVLSGRDGQVERVYPITNVETGMNRFRLHRQQQLRVMESIKAQGRQMLAIYHSHPRSAPYPSARDVRLAAFPGAAYVIVSLESLEQISVRAFRIAQGQVREIPLLVEPRQERVITRLIGAVRHLIQSAFRSPIPTG